MPHSAIALFCEDIRHERSGQITLIGILSDNLAVPAVPGLMPKLGVYVRIAIETNLLPTQIAARFTNTDDTIVPLPQWDQTTIQQGHRDAATYQLPIFGLLLTAAIAPFQIPQAGTMKIEVDIDGDTYVAGILNIVMTSATASPPLPAPAPPAPPQTASLP